MKNWIRAALAGVTIALSAPGVSAQDEITVAYFLEWPMPFLAAKADGSYDKALGTKVNWRSFDTGTAMSAAMAAGDVQISVSQGLPPFVVATSAGQDLQIIDIAVSYSDNDNCVVRTDLEIDKNNASELAGKKVAVPLGTAAHYGFLRQMAHFGVDLGKLEIVNMAPPEGAAAIAQKAVDMACGWGGALARMKEHGNVLLTGAEKEALGILVFDVTSTPARFAAEHEDLLARFVKVTADANARWAAGGERAKMLATIAKESGMDPAATEKSLATMTFPPLDAQLSGKWLGGGVQKFMKGVADVFLQAGSIKSALPTYENAVTVAPMKAAAR
ncbi:MAG: ABC transporter substrate-binding protein [Burkholderiaceae bacterium]